MDYSKLSNEELLKEYNNLCDELSELDCQIEYQQYEVTDQEIYFCFCEIEKRGL